MPNRIHQKLLIGAEMENAYLFEGRTVYNQELRMATQGVGPELENPKWVKLPASLGIGQIFSTEGPWSPSEASAAVERALIRSMRSKGEDISGPLGNFSAQKEKWIAERATQGYCYLNLLYTLDSCLHLDIFEFIRCANIFLMIGEFPTGTMVIRQLIICMMLCSGGELQEVSQYSNQVISLGYGTLATSNGRAKYREESAVVHVSPPTYNHVCHCTEPVCPHGVQARFFVAYLPRKDMTVGADYSEMTELLDELFVDARTTVTAKPEAKGKGKGLESGFVVRNFKPEVEPLKLPHKDLSDVRERVWAGKEALRVHEEEHAKISAQVEEDIDELDSLAPSDARSNIDSLGRKYFSRGTSVRPGVVSTGFGGGLVKHRMATIPEVVMGFQRTQDLVDIEEEAASRAVPINGLANPFRDNRLNLLAHLHTASRRLLDSAHIPSYTQMMESLTKARGRDPSLILLKQVAGVTFDVDNWVVLANPFRLPYIELGMEVNEVVLNKCFDLLFDEYKRLWFDQVKDLIVPTFHSIYEERGRDHRHRDDAPRRERAGSSKHSSSHSKGSGRAGSTQGSVISSRSSGPKR